MASNREQTARHALMNLSTAILYFEGIVSNVQISEDALKAWQVKVDQYIVQPYDRIFERQQPQAATEFTQGLINVSGSACGMVRSEGAFTSHRF